MTDLHETVAARMRAAHQRYTPGRRALVDLLASAPQPVSIPDVLDADPEVAQSTAYRNLAVLEQAGVVHRIATVSDHARFELAEDLTEHHHHLICTACGSVEDFTVPAALERTLQRATSEIADAAGFVTDGHRLDLVGRCAGCR
jgi:Fe2+ or Zn2+ uptake regulation protein